MYTFGDILLLLIISSTPLILASELGFLDIAETLLENKADINQQGFRGRLDFSK